MAHHTYQNHNQKQNAWNQQLTHRDQLKAYESLLLQEIASEESSLKRPLPLREVFLALLRARYRHTLLHAKMQRRERLERLQAQLAVLRDKLALSS